MHSFNHTRRLCVSTTQSKQCANKYLNKQGSGCRHTHTHTPNYSLTGLVAPKAVLTLLMKAFTFILKEIQEQIGTPDWTINKPIIIPVHKHVTDERKDKVNVTCPAKPNSFMALASQFSVSAWFLGFFCANAKDTTCTATTGQDVTDQLNITDHNQKKHWSADTHKNYKKIYKQERFSVLYMYYDKQCCWQRNPYL